MKLLNFENLKIHILKVVNCKIDKMKIGSSKIEICKFADFVVDFVGTEVCYAHTLRARVVEGAQHGCSGSSALDGAWSDKPFRPESRLAAAAPTKTTRRQGSSWHDGGEPRRLVKLGSKSRAGKTP